MKNSEVLRTFPSINEEFAQNSRYYHDPTIIETLTLTDDQTKRNLKTFTGVFCPVALAQFSSLLFLRLGFVLGQTGLLLAILQLIMAYVILLLTVLSICAISTNGAIKGGGVYFMISRTLGPEVGGSIGILFFLANVFSSALFMAAFVEGLVDDFGPLGRIDPNIIQDNFGWNYLFATCICIFCLGVCLVGGSLFAKTNLFIFIIVFVCFLSVIASFFFHKPFQVEIPKINKIVYGHTNETQYGNYTGLSGKTFMNNLYASYTLDFTTMKAMSFFTVFAILFPGVTGIMNGANMSGELVKPAISIPRGTLAATLFTFICYIISFFLSAATWDRFLLWNNYLFMQATNLWKPFVIIGMFLTCISAGLGNFIGASRILFALAQDDIFGIFLKPAKFTSKGGNPIGSVLISFVLVQIVLLIGKVNVIAPVVSVFFLLAYASVNLACALLDWAAASNFSLGSLVVTLCIQLSVVRDLEKMSGWHRISIIYILSGIMGNMCSGIFLPYQVQTGASGSIFAMLAMTFAEFLQSWKIVERPWPVFFKFLGLGIFLFLLGFLPFFDNYAHMSGLISGIILSLIFLPFLGMPNKAALEKLIASSVNPKEAWEKFQIKTKRRRMAIIIGCAGLWLLLMAICIVLFYWLPVTKCSFCKYLNCIPITPYFCDNMDVNVTSKTACILKD